MMAKFNISIIYDLTQCCLDFSAVFLVRFYSISSGFFSLVVLFIWMQSIKQHNMLNYLMFLILLTVYKRHGYVCIENSTFSHK